jgi:hypothetical protein
MSTIKVPPPRRRPPKKTLYDTNYFVFSKTYGDDDIQWASISKTPKLPEGSHNWRTGHLIKTEIPTPLIYEIDPDDEGELIPYYDAVAQPLMSDDLVNALQKSGVNNLEVFPAVIRETRTGREYTNYKAVNIVGLVAAADSTSETKDLGLGNGDGMLDSWFSKLVVDEEKAGGFLMFRMAENVTTILIHKKVKDALESADVPRKEHLMFIHPAKWIG